jgi:hypothetical protein
MTNPAWRSSSAGRPWSFDSDGALFRLVSEAKWIRLADPFASSLSTAVRDSHHRQARGGAHRQFGFLETNLVIARLDKLLRNEDVQYKRQTPDCRWTSMVCDEAHKMSATIFGGGGVTKYTKRYRLGQVLSTMTQHFLLMSATRHNGKEEDFQTNASATWWAESSPPGGRRHGWRPFVALQRIWIHHLGSSAIADVNWPMSEETANLVRVVNRGRSAAKRFRGSRPRLR